MLRKLTFTRTRFLAQRLHFAQKKLIGIRVVIPLAAYNVANNDCALWGGNAIYNF